MKALVFDTGPLISLSDNCLLWVLREIKERSRFLITPTVYYEAVQHPLEIRKYELNALRIEEAVRNGVLEFPPRHLMEKAGDISRDILHSANRIFYIRGEPLKILHRGEAEVLALATLTETRLVVIDERTGRKLTEDWKDVRRRLRERYGPVKVNRTALDEYLSLTGDLRFVRSSEIIALAYEKGLFDSYPDPRKFLEAALYAVKYHGCAVGSEEIDEYLMGV